MELQDLSREEKIVSIALFRFLVAADGVGSADEAVHVAKVAEAYGDEYEALLSEAEKCHETEEEFKALVAKIEGQDARELIYGTVMECADEDGVDHRESEFLSWLAGEWGIKVQTIDGPE